MKTEDIKDMVNKLHAARLGKEEKDEIMKVLKEGKLSPLSSEKVHQFEREFAEYCGAKYAIAVSSGTAALHCALAACGISCGDEVIIPAFSFSSLPFAVLYQNAIPIFADIEMDSYCIDPDQIEEQITRRTKAIIPVHLFGHPADMKKIIEIAEKYDLIVIEDCAHAHGAEINGKKVGTFGHVGCFSFQEYKIITTGEGGIITTNDAELAQRLRVISSMDEMDYDYLSYSYRMDAIRAAIGIAQLRKLDSLIARRTEIAKRYSDELEGFLITPKTKKNIKHSFNYYACRVPTERMRNKIFFELLKEGIPVIIFYDRPLNKLSIFHKADKPCVFKCPLVSLEHFFKNRDTKFVNSESFARQHFLLPISAALNDENLDVIIEKIKKIINNVRLEYVIPLSTCLV